MELLGLKLVTRHSNIGNRIPTLGLIYFTTTTVDTFITLTLAVQSGFASLFLLMNGQYCSFHLHVSISIL